MIRKISSTMLAGGLPLLALALFWSLLSAGPTQANPLLRPLSINREVTSIADSGAGTLRQAMLDSGPGDSISFNPATFPVTSPVTITLSSALPTIITDNLTIDAGNAGVILDGSGTPGGTNGLDIDGASGVTIKGLQILNFPLKGIQIRNGANQNSVGGSNGTPGGACSDDCNLISGNGDQGIGIYDSGTMSNTISGNYIGTNVSGTAPISNIENGIEIGSDATNNIIGGSRAAGEGNLISGNGEDGIKIFDSTTMSNTIKGNNIGTDASGTYAVGNSVHGFCCDGHYTIIGGSTADERNLISGNGQFNAISFFDAYAIIQGNYIGTNLTGTAVISNPNEGIFLSGTSHHNLITGNLISGNSSNGVGINGNDNTVSNNKIGTDVGGTFALPNDRGVNLRNGASRNVISNNLISGNLEEGVKVEGSGTMSNTINGNYIGTDILGVSALSNGEGGININNGSSNNIIGGSNGTPGGACSDDCNLISGNGDQGIGIYDSGTMSNTISGNYIGTNVSGTAPISNIENGIEIGSDATNNIIGGSRAAGEGNLISGNGEDGIKIFDSTTMSNTIKGNNIGTDASGTYAVGNSVHGFCCDGHYTIIGGSTADERNLISGNGQFNAISFFDAYAIIQGNYIGTNLTGTAIITNPNEGIFLSTTSHHNLITGNLISGNSDNGVGINGNDNTVSNNKIGTDVGGTFALPNDRGVNLRNGASRNVISNNLISGNLDNGVVIEGTGTMSNTVSGNYIGTDINGTTVISNGLDGVALSNGAQFNMIGGSNPTPDGGCTGECNLISGNSSAGVWISDGGTNNNTISGNYIGTDNTGTATLGNNDGLILISGAADNIIGGNTAAERNIFSGNEWGVAVVLSATRNVIKGNYIGTDASGTADLGNKAYGLQFHVGAHDNLAENNLIAFTKYRNADRPGPGVLILRVNTFNNTLRRNRIFKNDNKGILLRDGGNNGINRPVLTGVSTNTVQGTAKANSTIEIFSDAKDEGRYYHNTTTADAFGDFSYSQAAPFTGTNVTATATDGTGNSSEFSIRLQGTGAFQETGQANLGDLNSNAVALGDFDVDGDLDAFVANGSPNEVWFNDGTGRFALEQDDLGNESSQAVALGDIDQDGYLDAVVANALNEDSIIWLNNGNGTFSADPDHLSNHDSQGVAVGTLDDNDSPDIFLANAGNVANEIWLNNGSGNFDAGPDIQLGAEDSQAVALGDLDDDGDLDLVVINGSGQPDEVWLNNGSGAFGSNPGQPDSQPDHELVAGDGQAVALGYLEGENDEDLDAFVVGQGDQLSVVWLNDGSGNFNISQTVAISNVNAVAIGDFNADGVDDVVVGGAAGQANQILLNNGDGTFNIVSVPGNDEADSQAVALGDLDNDGDIDAFIGNSDEVDDGEENQNNQVLINLNQQPDLSGFQGGTLDFSQGMTLTIDIPPGALASTTPFTFTPRGAPGHADGSDLAFGGRAFSLDGPTTFNDKRITATIYFNPDVSPKPRLYYWETSGDNADSWVDVVDTCDPPTDYSYSSNWFKVPFCHLTDFSLFGVAGSDVYLPIIVKDD